VISGLDHLVVLVRDIAASVAAYLSWRVADIDATRARLVAAGVDVGRHAIERPPGEGKSGVLAFILKSRRACYILMSAIIERRIWPRQSEF
jgi:hypothetical protein